MSKTKEQRINKISKHKRKQMEDNPFYIHADVKPNAFGNTDWEHLLLTGEIKPIRQ